MADDKINSIFVYGTLRKGFHNYDSYLAGHIIEEYAGTVKGKLYHLKYGYPALVAGEGTVYGEIMVVRDIDSLLPRLDDLEDFNRPGREDLYKRAVKPARDERGNIINCYVYLWSPMRIDELEGNGVYISHGDWKRFMMPGGVP